MQNLSNTSGKLITEHPGTYENEVVPQHSPYPYRFARRFPLQKVSIMKIYSDSGDSRCIALSMVAECTQGAVRLLFCSCRTYCLVIRSAVGIFVPR